jgi:hypothetical protein
MLNATSMSFLDEIGQAQEQPASSHDHGPPLLLEVRLFDSWSHVFAGKDVGHRSLATAILEMVYLDLDIFGLIANGSLPQGGLFPSPILTAWHASGLDDVSASRGTPIFVGPIDCFQTFFHAVRTLRGTRQDRDQVERDLEKCRGFTFAGLVAEKRERFALVKWLDQEDDLNPV